MTLIKIIPNGTRVEYHGSLTHYHGEMTVDGFHQEYVDTNGEYSTLRYYLRYGPGMRDTLHNVRPESFTVMTDEDVHPDEDNGHA